MDTEKIQDNTVEESTEEEIEETASPEKNAEKEPETVLASIYPTDQIRSLLEELDSVQVKGVALCNLIAKISAVLDSAGKIVYVDKAFFE